VAEVEQEGFKNTFQVDFSFRINIFLSNYSKEQVEQEELIYHINRCFRSIFNFFNNYISRWRRWRRWSSSSWNRNSKNPGIPGGSGGGGAAYGRGVLLVSK
jgi:hypothetical protein